MWQPPGLEIPETMTVGSEAASVLSAVLHPADLASLDLQAHVQ